MKHVNRQWDVTQLVEQLILTANIHSLNPAITHSRMTSYQCDQIWLF